MKRLNVVFLLFITAVVVSGCSALTGNNESNEVVVEESQAPAPEAEPEVASGMEAMENADIIVELLAENFTFGEDEIVVEKDSVVTVRVNNLEGSHDFVIDELGIDTGLIEEGDFAEVVIPTDRVGEFSYYCSVGNHRAQGMEGKLIIQ